MLRFFLNQQMDCYYWSNGNGLIYATHFDSQILIMLRPFLSGDLLPRIRCLDREGDKYDAECIWNLWRSVTKMWTNERCPRMLHVPNVKSTRAMRYLCIAGISYTQTKRYIIFHSFMERIRFASYDCRRKDKTVALNVGRKTVRLGPIWRETTLSETIYTRIIHNNRNVFLCAAICI